MARKKAASKPIFSLYGELTMLGWEQAGQKLRDLDGKFAKFSNNMNLLGRQMTKIGKSISINISAPLAAAAGAAIKFGADFDKAMTTSTAIMGNVDADLRKRMEETARTIATETTISATEAANAYYYLASAGKDAEQSIALLPAVSKFAMAGQFDLERATALLADAQSALGLSSKNAAVDQKNMVRVSDVLVKANTLANASVEQFSEALTNRAAASLRMVNKSVEEGVAVLAAFAQQGIKGAEAGTQFAIVMRDLQNKAINESEAFKATNVAVFDQNGAMRNMADIIYDLEEALFGLSDAQKKATLMEMGFTDKSVASLLALIGLSNGIKDFETALKDAGGTTEDVSDKQLKAFWAQVTILKNQLVDVGITISNFFIPPINNYLIPALKAVAAGLREMTTAIDEGNPVLKGLIQMITAIGIVSGPAILGLGKLITTLGHLRKSLQLIKLAMVGNPIGLIAVAVASLAGAAFTAYAAYKQGNEALEKNREEIQKQLDSKIHEQQNNLLQEAIYHYEKLSKMDKVVMSKEEYKQSKDALNNLETSLGDFGITFEGSFISKLEKAKEKLAELNGEISDSGALIMEDMQIKGDSEKEIIQKSLDEKKRQIKEFWEFYDKHENIFDEILEEQRKEREKKEKEELKAKKKRAKEFQAYLTDLYSGIKEIADDTMNALDNDEQRALERKKVVEESKIAIARNSFGIINGIVQTQLNVLEGRYAKEKKLIEESVTDETEKKAALERLEEKYANKILEMKRAQAINNKLLSIFEIGLNVATGITAALRDPGGLLGIVLSSTIGALGAAQLATVISTPLPLQTGGYTEGSALGSLAMIGENNTKEIVLPLETGINKLATGLINQLGNISNYGSSNSSSLSTTSNGGTNRNLTLNIGTYIGDKRSLKELTRKIIPIINSENQRKAFSY